MQSRTFKTAVFYARSLTNKGGGRNERGRGEGEREGRRKGERRRGSESFPNASATLHRMKIIEFFRRLLSITETFCRRSDRSATLNWRFHGSKVKFQVRRTMDRYEGRDRVDGETSFSWPTKPANPTWVYSN